MNRFLSSAVALLAGVLSVGAALAQGLPPHATSVHPPSAGGAPDVPAGPGTLRGRVVHAGSGEGVSDVPLLLYALTVDGAAGMRTISSDEDGAFAFSEISNDPGTIYLIGAKFDEVPFGLRAAFPVGETEHVVELSVSEPTADTSAVEMTGTRIRVDPACEGLWFLEDHELRNSTDQVVFVPPEARGTTAALLRLALPVGARAVETSAAGADTGLVHEGDELVFWGPLHPGELQIQVGYGLTGGGAAIAADRVFPSGTPQVTLLTPSVGPSLVEASALRVGPLRELEGQSYRTAVAGPLAPGESLSFSVEPPGIRSAASGLEWTRSLAWLELDDAALSVSEQHEFSVETSGPLIAPGGAPLVCLDVPAGASGLRFSSETLALGLSRDPSGDLAVRGPLPPGEQRLSLRYTLPVENGTAVYSRRLPFDLRVLSIFVADTGVLPATDRLHRRRPVRTGDRTFLQLEGFEIAAGEVVEVSLSPLAAPGRIPGWAAAGLVFGAAAAALVFLGAPLRGERDEVASAETAATRAAVEREAVYAAIRALEEDFEVGKVDADDYAELRDQLRAKAVSSMREERAAAERESHARGGDPTPAGCPGCGAEVSVGAFFCSQCGSALAANPPEEAAG